MFICFLPSFLEQEFLASWSSRLFVEAGVTVDVELDAMFGVQLGELQPLSTTSVNVRRRRSTLVSPVVISNSSPLRHQWRAAVGSRKGSVHGPSLGSMSPPLRKLSEDFSETPEHPSSRGSHFAGPRRGSMQPLESQPSVSGTISSEDSEPGRSKIDHERAQELRDKMATVRHVSSVLRVLASVVFSKYGNSPPAPSSPEPEQAEEPEGGDPFTPLHRLAGLTPLTKLPGCPSELFQEEYLLLRALVAVLRSPDASVKTNALAGMVHCFGNLRRTRKA